MVTIGPFHYEFWFPNNSHDATPSSGALACNHPYIFGVGDPQTTAGYWMFDSDDEEFSSPTPQVQLVESILGHAFMISIVKRDDLGFPIPEVWIEIHVAADPTNIDIGLGSQSQIGSDADVEPGGVGNFITAVYGSEDIPFRNPDDPFDISPIPVLLSFTTEDPAAPFVPAIRVVASVPVVSAPR